MAENTTNYQCPACTGPLRFDSASGKLCCDYCGSTYDVAQVEALYSEKQAQADKAAEAAEKAASSGPVWGEMETGNLSSRTCTSCGAELVCGPETAATTCPYCGNPTVLGGQLSGKLKPEYIIPFRMDKKTAIENLKKYYKGKAFLPKAFKESNHIEEIQGVYVPFWLYDGRMEARQKTEADEYMPGFTLRVKRDRYTHTTRERTYDPPQKESHSSGGSSVDSDGFGGSSGGSF